ncbi:hypothetical protein FSP39_002683 [Pinctada imbricata]|uniref:U11/U12 small nuclear ribonucleoprotein 35 kDa protein n=1 Tax=Pinctada imbricata TaxID=66713 RepID=A0AA88YH18_PINIB|nr:hypothetical protein FSP39_002683 [Pinctada imbricata]
MSSWSPLAKVYDPLKAGSIDTTDDEPHDHGVIRAINSTYKPNKDVTGDPHCTIFVARLNPKTSEETLESELSCFGKIKRVRLVRDIVTGFSRCYSFVEFEDEKSAMRAHREGNNLEIDGHEVFVDFELERTLPGWIPRRKGGGFGGKKESGQLRFGGRDRPWREPILLQDQRNRQQRYSDRDQRGTEQRYNDRDRGTRNYDRDRYDKGRSDRSTDRRDRRRDRSRSREKYRHRSRSR